MENSNNFGKILGALIVGAAVGGALGILFAPDKGSKTRSRIFDQGGDISEALKDKFNEILDGSKQGLESAKEKANEFAMEGKERFEDMKEKTHELIYDGKSKGSNSKG